MSDKPPRTITIGWLFSALFLLMGITSFASAPAAALLFCLASLFSFPPAAAFQQRFSGVNLSKGLRAFLVVVCLLAAGAANNDSIGTAGGLSPGQPSPTERSATSEPKLEVQSFRVYQQYGYAHIDGLVKNISAESMDAVVAVAEFYASDGTFVKSADALIEYNPILAGQSSPFEVLTTDNPAITEGKISFKEFWGGTIPTRHATEQ